MQIFEIFVLFREGLHDVKCYVLLRFSVQFFSKTAQFFEKQTQNVGILRLLSPELRSFLGYKRCAHFWTVKLRRRAISALICEISYAVRTLHLSIRLACGAR